MDRQRELANAIVKSLYAIAEGFDEYWDAMDSIDHNEILEQVADSIYDFENNRVYNEVDDCA